MAKRSGSQKVAIALAFVGLGALALYLMEDSDLLVQAQRAGTTAGFDSDKVELAAKWDFLFIASLLSLFVYLFSLIRNGKGWRGLHPASWAGIAMATAGAIADVVENLYLLRAFPGNDPWLGEMRVAGLVKFGFLGGAALTLLTLTVLRSWRAPTKLGHPTDRPDHLAPTDPKKPHPWEPPSAGGKHRVGVSLSGGGVRSAAFSLGALQTLREKGKLDKAEYITAASGGGYLAAGWAVSQARAATSAPGASTVKPWDPGSPEERWFRDNSSYLIPDLKGGVAGLVRLLAGLAVNIALVGLLLAAMARPIGWAIHELHPELRAGQPVVLARDASADMEISEGELVLLGTVDQGLSTAPVARYVIALSPADSLSRLACFYEPEHPKRPDRCVTAIENADERGVVEVQSGRAKVVKHPQVRVNPASDTLAERAQIARQPKVSVVDDLVVDGQAPTSSQFKVERQPLASTATGLATMKWATYESWMWELVGGLTAASALAAMSVTAFRPRGRKSEFFRSIAKGLGGAALIAFLVIIGLPWLVIWLPRALAKLAEKSADSLMGSALFDYLLPGGGLVAIVLTASSQFLAGSKSKEGSGTGDTKPFYKKLWDKLSKSKKELKWYETSPTKILVSILSLVAVIVVFVNALQFAVANGPDGRLMGFAFVRDFLPAWAFRTDVEEFAGIVAFLVGFAWVADAHTWSLFPFYKERLSSAYLLHRSAPDRAEPIPYDELVKFSSLKDAPGPQLVACCAVNLNETGVVPPGRRAAAFTFSSTEIGGPLVGYARTEDYERLPMSRRRDATVASAMAISGAAFSPAMGKFNLGPVGTVLALANLRLGIWIPHPCRARVAEKTNREWDWWRFRRPHWVWFLRELTNKYKFNRRYLYVSDGGHWDNLGLVELFRRGCTEIYCISGAGDGADSFGTIGEAIALAREELGVEVTLDTSPLRARASGGGDSKRELRRRGAKDKAAAYAAAGAVKGTFRYTRSPGAKEGVLYYVEADLTEDIPMDVHAFAESEPDFPDESTGDQVFNHRQFESYRALGRHQAKAAVTLAEPKPPEPSCAAKLKTRVKKAICP